MSRLKQAAVLIFFSVICIFTDLLAKAYFQSRLEHQVIAESYIFDSVRFVYAENRGAFLGIFSELPAIGFIIIGTILVIGMLVFLYSQPARDMLTTAMIGLLIGGAIGNLIDRYQYGFVRDFINMGIGPLRTGIFNIADVAITGGVIVLFLRTVFQRQHAIAVNTA